MSHDRIERDNAEKVAHMNFYAFRFADKQPEALYTSNTAAPNSGNKYFQDFAIQLPENCITEKLHRKTEHEKIRIIRTVENK